MKIKSVLATQIPNPPRYSEPVQISYRLQDLQDLAVLHRFLQNETCGCKALSYLSQILIKKVVKSLKAVHDTGYQDKTIGDKL